MAGKLRIGMIGCGGNARGHGGRLTKIPEVQIAAITDVSEDALGAFRKTVPGAENLPAYSDYTKMLKEIELDAVEISTPHTLHFEQIMACLEKGLHVLCEKPLVCTVDHAKKVCEKAKSSKKHLMISYQRHFMGPYVYAQRAVASGQLGEPTFLTTWQSQNWMEATKRWRGDPKLSGGGQLNDSGSHMIDVLLWISGLQPKDVFAFVDNRGANVDAVSAISVQFTNGASGNISIIGDCVGPRFKVYEEILLWCKNGQLVIRDNQLFRRDGDAELFQVPPEGLPRDNNPDQAFVDLIYGRAPNVVPPECGLRVIQLTEGAWKSAETGKPVKVKT
ncbi:MAG: Gfo/Idh/MocA family oxidoreductase [Planctomycetota bacterium]